MYRHLAYINSCFISNIVNIKFVYSRNSKTDFYLNDNKSFDINVRYKSCCTFNKPCNKT